MSFLSKLFGGSSKTSAQKAPVQEKPQLSDEEKKNLEDQVASLSSDLESENDNKVKADLLSKLGKAYQGLGEADQAISSYEESLKLNEDFGPAFDGLLDLYNQKRKEASYAKDDDAIQKWLNKSDELTALSKKIMRSK